MSNVQVYSAVSGGALFSYAWADELSLESVFYFECRLLRAMPQERNPMHTYYYHRTALLGEGADVARIEVRGDYYRGWDDYNELLFDLVLRSDAPQAPDS
jgi:hypothetical protein